MAKFISIHAPRAGSDAYHLLYLLHLSGFQSTLPVRGATRAAGINTSGTPISIHAPRAGSDPAPTLPCAPSAFQSTLPVRGATHALHQRTPKPIYFNPRSPCGERLCGWRRWPPRPVYFNPRSPCGERLVVLMAIKAGAGISIHAPRAGSDFLLYSWFIQPCVFQSTLPVRGATEANSPIPSGRKVFQSTLPVRGATIILCNVDQLFDISIHAPRAGSDC